MRSIDKTEAMQPRLFDELSGHLEPPVTNPREEIEEEIGRLTAEQHDLEIDGLERTGYIPDNRQIREIVRKLTNLEVELTSLLKPSDFTKQNEGLDGFGEDRMRAARVADENRLMEQGRQYWQGIVSGKIHNPNIKLGDRYLTAQEGRGVGQRFKRRR